MARLTLPSRLELKRPEGSFREAPLAKVIFTTSLYVSPVQIIPACDHTGTPLHFHSSTTSGSACLIRIRTLARVSPRQSLSSLILASISREGESPPFPSFEPLFLFFIVVVACLSLGRLTRPAAGHGRVTRHLPRCREDGSILGHNRRGTQGHCGVEQGRSRSS